MTTWKQLTTLEKVAEVREAHGQCSGTSATIAAVLTEKFGTTISRNAVIGLYGRRPALFNDRPLTGSSHYVKRSDRDKVVSVAVPKPKATKLAKAKVKPLVGFAQFARKAPDPVKMAEVKRLEERPAPSSMPKPLFVDVLSLERTHCRWPVAGEKASTLFCGHNTDGNGSYCAGHHRMSISVRTLQSVAQLAGKAV